MKRTYMKQILALVFALLLAVNVDAETTERVSETIIAADYIELDEVLGMGEEAVIEDEDEQAFFDELQELNLCKGLYVQNRGDSDSAYTADIAFFLAKGVPYCSIKYDNFMGEIEDGQVQRIAEILEHEKGILTDEIENSSDNYVLDDQYTYVIYTTGSLGPENELDFVIQFNQDAMHIHWGDICDYDLHRSLGSVEELKDTPFEETDDYGLIIENADRVFGNTDHGYKYVTEEKTIYAYVALGHNAKQKMLLNADLMRDDWSGIIDTMKNTSSQLGEIVALFTQPSITKILNHERDAHDLLTGHFCIVLVDELNENHQYEDNHVLAIITDGEVDYDCLFTEPVNDGTNTITIPNNGATTYGDGQATMGERNALSKAMDYLAYTSFSYTGLIEQLEFEGYSHSEAKYGADHCGANWYEQAKYKARDYLDYTSFSRTGLIEQLEFEGFTYDQAVYGVEQNGY